MPTPDSYEVSPGYVVETVASELDAGTGGLAVDGDGNLYHADFGYPDHVGNTIFKVTPDGEVSEFATSDLFTSLTGNTFGPDGKLYQSSFGSNNVVTVDPDGTVELLTDEVRGPTGIVVTDEGRVFVDSCRRNQVFEVFGDGTVEVFAGGVGMNCPNGLTIDDDGNLYVVNFSSGFMQRITPTGEIEAIYRFPSGNAHVVHVDGYLYVTARTDDRVYRYEIATGDVVTVVGTGDEGRAWAGGITALMTGAAYRASAEMAAELEAQREARSLGATDTEVMERFTNSVLAAGTNPSHQGGDNAG